MDSMKDEFDKLAKDPNRLYEYLAEHIDEMSRTLNDDEDFCNQDIDATIDYVKNMKRKFIEKFQEFETKLENIRRDNQKISEENKTKFNEEIREINELFEAKKYSEGMYTISFIFFSSTRKFIFLAWKKFKDYEKSFQQRSTVIQQIPKLYMNETDIERCFAPDHRPTTDPPPPLPTLPILTTTEDDKLDSSDDILLTSKEENRRKKKIETVHIDKDNEELNIEKNEQTIDQ